MAVLRDARVLPDGSRIRWVEVPGDEPPRLYLHGLGASSAPYYAAAVAHPLLQERRSLLLDLLGFGLSDRPETFGYTLDDHADTIATALAGLDGLEVVAHSMGGAVAVALAHRHPRLVARLVLIDSNLDPQQPRTGPGSPGIATYTEHEFLHGVGWERTLRRAGPQWGATMRLSSPIALYRTALSLIRTTARQQLTALSIPRVYLHPEGQPPLDADGLRAAGVQVVEIPGSGHNIMLDNLDAFAKAVVSS